MYFIIDFKSEQEIRKAKIDDSDSLKELTITGKDFFCLAARIVNYKTAM
ncbi:Uncharacterised protein [Enterococcus faecalis]|nr:Uncharacterised protein [Enterococcus faecalis]